MGRQSNQDFGGGNGVPDSGREIWENLTRRMANGAVHAQRQRHDDYPETGAEHSSPALMKVSRYHNRYNTHPRRRVPASSYFHPSSPASSPTSAVWSAPVDLTFPITGGHFNNSKCHDLPRPIVSSHFLGFIVFQSTSDISRDWPDLSLLEGEDNYGPSSSGQSTFESLLESSPERPRQEHDNYPGTVVGPSTIPVKPAFHAVRYNNNSKRHNFPPRP